MSSAIKDALDNVMNAVDNVEAALIRHQKKPKKTAQPDLFSQPPMPAGPVSGSVLNFSRDALARKLDMTIAKVEQLLGEG